MDHKAHNQTILLKIRNGEPVGQDCLRLGFGYIIRFFSEAPYGPGMGADIGASLIRQYESGDEIVLTKIQRTIYPSKSRKKMLAWWQKHCLNQCLSTIKTHFGAEQSWDKRDKIIAATRIRKPVR